MKINISSWQQVKYCAYRYYLVEDRFLKGYVYSWLLSLVMLYITISKHMDPFYPEFFVLVVMFSFFYPFLPMHWKLFRQQKLTVNLTGNLLQVYNDGIIYGIDLNRYAFKKIAGYYVLTAGGQVFFFTQSQFDELRRS